MSWKRTKQFDIADNFGRIKMMRFIALGTVALSLLLAGTAFAQEWIDFSSRSDFFTINFPAEPKVKDITYLTEYSISLPARVYSYENGASRYSVTIVDYTVEEKIEADPRKALTAA